MERIELRNVGTDELILAQAALDADCAPGFSLLSAFAPGSVLAAGEATLVELTYDASDTSAALCTLTLSSDAVNAPAIVVTARANTSTNARNTAPTVAIRSPAAGHSYDSPAALEIEFNLFDADQPATTLGCRVTSYTRAANVATCVVSDDSGHAVVSIPRADLDAGVDTLAIVVTDDNGITATASLPLVVSAAYPDSDDDGDAYGSVGDVVDCDDHERDTYPGATELHDGADNDCDGVTDEGTAGFDDDGDGITEVDGDCDDTRATAYPTAPERADGLDNDCDRVVDEGTSLYDDDGDGFAEVNNDCNDARADVSPAAAELCNGFDDDCDGLTDSADECAAVSSPPVVVGYPQPSENACLVGQPIRITAKVFDADGDALTHAWVTSEASPTAGFDNPTAATVTYTCPALLPEQTGGKRVTVVLLVTDPSGNRDWQSVDLAVYPADWDLYEPYVLVGDAP